ncbi:hypothetical protein BH11PLA1_BH11PLA1_21110 [soil metagenome]
MAKAQPLPNDLSYEDARAELQAIIERIESGEIGLEQSMAQYERGVALYQRCKQIQDQVEQKFADLTAQMQAETGGAAKRN